MYISQTLCLIHFFFFFQAEDGIRDLTVTGVQTCALPICSTASSGRLVRFQRASGPTPIRNSAGAISGTNTDRKSTRLNSSHSQISYAVFCLKKKKNKERKQHHQIYFRQTADRLIVEARRQ